MITKEELAEKLDNRQYGKEITKDEENEAKESGLVVIYGQSDDLIELKGAISDELGMYDGGTIYLNKDGILQNKCNDENCPYFKKEMENALEIEALWSDESGDAAWSFASKDINDFAKFNIYDGETLYCEGVIFNIEELKQ